MRMRSHRKTWSYTPAHHMFRQQAFHRRQVYKIYIYTCLIASAFLSFSIFYLRIYAGFFLPFSLFKIMKLLLFHKYWAITLYFIQLQYISVCIYFVLLLYYNFFTSLQLSLMNKLSFFIILDFQIKTDITSIFKS